MAERVLVWNYLVLSLSSPAFSFPLSLLLELLFSSKTLFSFPLFPAYVGTFHFHLSLFKESIFVEGGGFCHAS